MLPELDLFGIAIPTYLLTLSIVYCLGIFYFFLRLKKFGLSPIIASDLLLIAMVSGFVGARLAYVFYQEPAHYFKNPIQIFQFWHGGFIYYGGLFAGLGTCYAYLKFKKQNIGLWMNLSAPVLALGYGLGRLACFLNGCCYGAVCEWPWGVQFPLLTHARHPTQLYAFIFELFVWVFLLAIEKKAVFKSRNFGLLFYIWLIAHGLGRITMEYFRDDPRGAQIVGLSISTVISILIVLIASSILIRNFRSSDKSA